MTDEQGAVEETGAKKEFSIVRKGYDPAEVDDHLAEYDVALCELEEYAARLKRELSDAKQEIVRLAAGEQESIEKAMAAVFDAKERIIDRATAKAREIEDQARSAAGLPLALEAAASPIPSENPPPPKSIEEPLSSEIAAEKATGAVEPNEVLHQMLEQAETIRTRLDDGLAAAFDQMERMQHDAEERAAGLLDDARREAARLRTAAGSESAVSGETTIAVELPREEPAATDRPRQSRYARNSARLPRIGDDGGASVLETMNGLRTKLREGEEAAQ